MGRAASRAAGAPPYVVTLHGTDVALLGRSSVARALSRRILRAAAAVTAVSGYLADRAAGAAGIDRLAVTDVPRFVAALADAEWQPHAKSGSDPDFGPTGVGGGSENGV